MGSRRAGSHRAGCDVGWGPWGPHRGSVGPPLNLGPMGPPLGPHTWKIGEKKKTCASAQFFFFCSAGGIDLSMPQGPHDVGGGALGPPDSTDGPMGPPDKILMFFIGFYRVL